MGIQAPRTQVEKSKDVTVTWSWYNQQEGEVTWTFKNESDERKEVILLRGAVDQNGAVLLYYYFGNAYWVDYLSMSVTRWQTENTPLKEEENPPIAVVKIGDKYLVAFEFTLAPNMTWSMLEGGFVSGLQPYNPVAVPVKYLGDHHMCVGYDTKQVLDYVEQTGIPAPGYYPNPSTFLTSTYEAGSPYIQLFNDQVKKGVCTMAECIKIIRERIKKKK